MKIFTPAESNLERWMERWYFFLSVSWVLYVIWCYVTDTPNIFWGSKFAELDPLDSSGRDDSHIIMATGFPILLYYVFHMTVLKFLSIFFGVHSSFSQKDEMPVPILIILGWILIIFFISKYFYGDWWDLSGL